MMVMDANTIMLQNISVPTNKDLGLTLRSA